MIDEYGHRCFETVIALCTKISSAIDGNPPNPIDKATEPSWALPSLDNEYSGKLNTGKSNIAAYSIPLTKISLFWVE